MSPSFHPGQRVRLKEPGPQGARYFTLAYKRPSGWQASTVDLDGNYNPQAVLHIIRESEMEPVPTPWMRYGRLPWRPLLKLLASVPLGWLLMHANRRFRTTSFYELKDQVLKAFGRPDGNDLQELPAMPCWSCDGSGVERKFQYDTRRHEVTGAKCCDCHGTGEYAGKLYVRLERRKLAWFAFHKPTGSMYNYDQAVNLWQPKSEIHGLIQHDPNPKWVGYWCRIALSMLFDFPRFGPHFLKVTAQRLRWRVQRATEPLRRKLGWVLESDEDMLPF